MLKVQKSLHFIHVNCFVLPVFRVRTWWFRGMLKFYTKRRLFMKFSLRAYRTQFTVIIIVSILPRRNKTQKMRCDCCYCWWEEEEEAKCDCGLIVVPAASHSILSTLWHCITFLFLHNSIECIITSEPEIHSFLFSLSLLFSNSLFTSITSSHRKVKCVFYDSKIKIIKLELIVVFLYALHTIIWSHEE